jgi:hypothetical protein
MIAEHNNNNSILLILCLFVSVVVIGTTSNSCPIPQENYLTDTTVAKEHVLLHDTPVYYGFKVPQSWKIKGNSSIPTVVFRVEFPIGKCSDSNDSVDTMVEPVLTIGLNNVQKATNDSCSQVLRTVTNMTTVYTDVTDEIYVQYIAIYPNEIKQYSIPNAQLEFALMLKQSNCDSASYLIKVSYVKDIDLNANPLQTIMFSGLRQYFKYAVDSSVGENKILFGSLQYVPEDAPMTIRFKQDDYPSGENDLQFHYNTFSISPAPMYSVFYFYLEFQAVTASYVQQSIQVSMMMEKGNLCQKGCGTGGICNFTSGQCACFHHQGFYGDDCSVTGCKEGSDCSDDSMEGKLRCNGPEWSNAVCKIQSCKKRLFMLDTKANTCRRLFPAYIFASVLSGASVIAAILGFSIGIGACQLCANRFRRKHYHFVK